MISESDSLSLNPRKKSSKTAINSCASLTTLENDFDCLQLALTLAKSGSLMYLQITFFSQYTRVQVLTKYIP